MKKKWAFTAAAGVLGGLFLAGVLEVSEMRAFEHMPGKKK